MGDTDTQWAYWEGLKDFYKAKEGYLQGQIGNPEGEDKPNKSFYDPRVWLRKSETTMVTRVELAFKELGCDATMNKKDTKKKQEAKKKEEVNAPEDPAKKLKRVIKEGGKRGVEIEGA